MIKFNIIEVKGKNDLRLKIDEWRFKNLILEELGNYEIEEAGTGCI